MTESEAHQAVIGHVLKWVLEISFEYDMTDEQTESLKNSIFDNEVAQLWMAKQVAQLTGKVH